MLQILNFKENQLKDFFYSLLLGFVVFYIVTGFEIISPINISWLEFKKGDQATYYYGWLSYRNSPWTFPVGLNPNYGLELSSSIVFSDSIPLLAIFFKSISYILPKNFQYFGAWILFCFVFQC